MKITKEDGWKPVTIVCETRDELHLLLGAVGVSSLISISDCLKALGLEPPSFSRPHDVYKTLLGAARD